MTQLRALSLLSFFLFSLPVLAQSLRGVVSDAKGAAIPYASVRVQGLAEGAMCNEAGQYELKLKEGGYTLVFSALGYRTETRTVQVPTAQAVDVRLEDQAYTLHEQTVKRGEDPAYAIMRRAIAMAPIERRRVTAYQAQVYVKGGGRLLDVPWLLEGKIKEAGFDKNTVFFVESISEVSYQAPNKYKNRVKSIRSNMDKLGNGVNAPMEYVAGSFYDPLIRGAVSPLSPRAFSYYTFSYEGVFNDKGVEVNKIRVKPKSRGDDVFDGYVYIIEDQWCLHSLKLASTHEGITVETEQLFTPIQNVWLPATQKYKLHADIYGFEFEGTYIASLRDYKLTLNPALQVKAEVVDEKQAPAEAKAVNKQEKNADADELAKILTDTTKKMTRKSLRKLAKAMVKAERKAEKEEHKGDVVMSQDSMIVDTGAGKRDSAYWEANRAVPLTEMEQKSEVKFDSIGHKLKEEEKKDSAKNARRSGHGSSFDFMALFYGHTFRLNKDSGQRAHQLVYAGLVGGDASYNTVEGYVLATNLRYRYLWRPGPKGTPRNYFQVGPAVRYEFARNKLLPTADAELGYNRGRGLVRLSGGRGVSQINPAGAIDPTLNAVASLVFERNYMRLFQKDFIKLETANLIADRLQLNTSLELARRDTLGNNVKKPWINWSDRTYWPNHDPVRYGDARQNPPNTTQFEDNRAAVFSFSMKYAPVVRYSLHNGQRSYETGSEPYLHFGGSLGVPGIFKSSTNFLNLRLGLEQKLKIGVRASLYYYAEVGAFVYNKASYTPDYFHFEGNRTFLIVGDGLRSFRTLPYYFYSRPAPYMQQHVTYIPRRLLITRLPFVTALGWKESIGYHGLTYADARQYSELTYGFDGIFRFIRLEGVAVFNGVKFDYPAFRIGLTLKGRGPGLRRPNPNAAEQKGNSQLVISTDGTSMDAEVR